SIFIIVPVIVVAIYWRRREEVFEGEVVDKDVVENVNNTMPMDSRPGLHFGGPSGFSGTTHTYVVKVKTLAGKTITWQVSEGKYDIIKIGDRVSKPKGTTDLQILSSAAAPASATPPSDTPAQ